MILGNKIKLARLSVNDSQEKLAEKIGVSRQTIINWEQGRTVPDGESLVKLANYYSLSLDDWLELPISQDKNIGRSDRIKTYGIVWVYLLTLILVNLQSALFLTLAFLLVLSTLIIKEIIVTKH